MFKTHYPDGVEFEILAAALITNEKVAWRDWLASSVACRTTDESLLAKLAGDEYWDVRRAVAEHTTDESLLAKLAADTDWDVRFAVAWHTTDERLLAKLAADTEWYVQRAASERLREIEEKRKRKMK